MTRITLEAAIDAFEDAQRAVAEGADRLEVCAALDTGGLTPPAALLRQCLTLGVPCAAMARPRDGSYEYTAEKLNLLADDVRRLRDAGAHGVVFGVMTGTRTIDATATQRLVDACAGTDAVFHRVFDETPDPIAALETLIRCGITRLLTSGHAPSAIEGVDTLVRLQRHAAGRIAILPGGGVRAGNVREIVRRAAVTQVHARGSQPGVIAALRQALDAPPAT